jgi:hypothetical protein
MTSTPIIDNAAFALAGRTLKGRWRVINRIVPPASGTGGFFSVPYIVENDDGQAFLKALNFQAFFAMFPGKRVLEILAERTREW